MDSETMPLEKLVVPESRKEEILRCFHHSKGFCALGEATREIHGHQGAQIDRKGWLPCMVCITFPQSNMAIGNPRLIEVLKGKSSING